jgi:prolyl-tRNA synthetase
MRGVPLRLEIGPRDVKSRSALAVRRDTREKQPLSLDNLAPRVQDLLAEIQQGLFDQALRFREDNTHEVADYAEFKSVIEERRGFIKTLWCGVGECEDRIKEETMATIRVVLMDPDRTDASGACVCCGGEGRKQVYFARAY